MTEVFVPKADGKIQLGDEEFELTLPKGRAGRKNMLMVQEPYEKILASVKAAAGDMEVILGAARKLIGHVNFESKIMPFILQNSTKGWTEKEAKDFLEECSDSTLNFLYAYLNAVGFFLVGPNPEALSEALGKSEQEIEPEVA